MNTKAKQSLLNRQVRTHEKILSMLYNPKYTLEIIPTHNRDKFYLIKTYVKGKVRTVNQLCNGVLFYRKWEQYRVSGVSIVRDVKGVTNL
ncbi:hypothetical protein TPMD03_0 [Thiohalocapsa phage LS06-2018-MD03]|nr:hypothetical protein TPMD03_0 [Thiohalocapsa phage LS06-2018-MD03]